MNGLKLTMSIVLCTGLFVATFSTTSCTKERIITQKDTLLTESMLTAKTWEVNYVRGVYGNQVFYYQRGGSANTTTFDNEYFVFYPDHTGYSMDNDGYRHGIPSWNLIKKQDYVTITIQYYATPSGPITTLNWDNLKYKNGSFSYSHYYHDSYTGANYHGEEIRGPKVVATN